MQNLIREIEEFQRRFNFEMNNFLSKVKAMHEQTEKNSAALANNTSSITEKFVTVKRLSEIYPSFTEGSIRSMIFSNKWDFCGSCVVKASGRKTLIEVQKFEEWVKKPKLSHTAYAHLGVGR